MNKVTATVIKEWLLMRRDIGGLILLLIMPAALIVVMALVQDAPFRDYQELRFDLLLADNDGGSLAREIKTGLRQSRHFHVIDSLDGKPLQADRLRQLLQQGDYRVGIVIPQGATAEVINAANIVANSVAEKLGMGRLPVRERRDSLHVQVYFDPVAKPTFKTSIAFALDKYVTYSCSNLLVQRISKLNKLGGDTTAASDDFKKIFGGIGIQEAVLNDQGPKKHHINSVQHNVPAWAIFGMFFIVIPLSGHMIREREEGSALRVKLIPYAQTGVALGKILSYTLLCILQFVLMCCIGIWVLPLLGLSSLYLGQHPAAMIPVVIAVAFAATSYGFFVGTVFKTANQAVPFGAISVVILSAMGGIWVPIDLLPPVMQKVAHASPLHWGLDGIHQIILRDLSFSSIWLNVAVLTGLGILLSGISLLRTRSRTHSVQ